MAIPVIDAVVFQMTDALTRKEMDRAFSVLHDLLRLQQAPIMILAVLGKHFRQLYTAGGPGVWRGEPVAHGTVGDAVGLSGGQADGRGPPPWAGLVPPGHAPVRGDRPGYESVSGPTPRNCWSPWCWSWRQEGQHAEIREAIVVEADMTKTPCPSWWTRLILETSGFWDF